MRGQRDLPRTLCDHGRSGEHSFATDQIEHDFVSDVLTDIEPETTRDYGGWFNWQVIYVVYEERSLDPPPLTLSTWSMKIIDMYWILVEELDARCRIHHFPPDVSYDRDTARRWWATIEITAPEQEDSSFLAIQDHTPIRDDTPSTRPSRTEHAST